MSDGQNGWLLALRALCYVVVWTARGLLALMLTAAVFLFAIAIYDHWHQWHEAFQALAVVGAIVLAASIYATAAMYLETR